MEYVIERKTPRGKKLVRKSSGEARLFPNKGAASRYVKHHFIEDGEIIPVDIYALADRDEWKHWHAAAKRDSDKWLKENDA